MQREVEWMTADEVAFQFQVSNATVYRMVREGTIPAIKFGTTVRIPRSWYDRELERFRTGRSVEEASQTQLIENGRRIMQAVAAAERAGAI